MKRAAALVALCFLVCSCEDQAAAPAQQGAAASGEVLPGSISDKMIPLEELDSQAPLAPRRAAPGEDVDAEQPDVEPVEGVDTAAPPGADAASAPDAAPAPGE